MKNFQVYYVNHKPFKTLTYGSGDGGGEGGEEVLCDISNVIKNSN